MVKAQKIFANKTFTYGQCYFFCYNGYNNISKCNEQKQVANDLVLRELSFGGR